MSIYLISVLNTDINIFIREPGIHVDFYPLNCQWKNSPRFRGICPWGGTAWHCAGVWLVDYFGRPNIDSDNMLVRIC